MTLLLEHARRTVCDADATSLHFCFGGLQLFDDWLVDHIQRLIWVLHKLQDSRYTSQVVDEQNCGTRSSSIPIEVILEAPVPADEVELHIEAQCTQ